MDKTYHKRCCRANSYLSSSTATALVGATLANWQRKREEEKARREAARAERQANGPGTYRQAAMDYQRALDNFKAVLVENGVDPATAAQLKSKLGGEFPAQF